MASDLPPGFVLDQQPQAGLPPGFVLDNPNADVRTGAPTRSAGTVGMEAMLNAGPSALQYGKDTASAFLHPIQTAKAIGSLITDPNARAAAGQFYKDRYGGMENIKRTIATDPVGMLADVAAPFTLGGTALARVPGAVGKVGQAVKTAGEMADPLTAAGYAAKGASKITGETAAATFGVTTGAGRTPIKEAARVGYSGDLEENLAFLGNLRGTVPRDHVLRDAKSALQAIRQERGGAYDRQMSLLNLDDTKLDFAPVQSALSKTIDSVHTRAGTSVLDGADQSVLDRITATIAEWEANPAEHTINGLDGLKKRIRGIYPTPDNTQASRIVGDLEKSVKGIIEQQAPQYAQIMRTYADESRLIDEVEASLSLGNTKTTDTALRKLQSVMRNNVNTNYGQRADLVDTLEQRGGKQIVPALAGQSLNAPEPRGWGGYLAGGNVGATGMGAIMTGNPWALASIPAQMAAASPRVVGEATYGGARLAGRTADLIKALGGANTARSAGNIGFQSGRMNREEQRRQALIRQLAGIQ